MREHAPHQHCTLRVITATTARMRLDAAAQTPDHGEHAALAVHIAPELTQTGPAAR